MSVVPIASPPTATQSCKVIVFETAGFRFALPLNTVTRIVHRSLLQADATVADLLYFEHQPLEVIDLARQLRPETTPQDPAPFFLITQVGRRLAIAADRPPAMVDLPLDTVHPIPATYRSALQGMAQHMVTLGNAEVTQSVFLLELRTLAELFIPATHEYST